MLTINVLCVGKIKEKFFKEAIDEYSKRLSKYCKLNIIEVQDEKIPDNSSGKIEEKIKNKECETLISHLKKDSYVIALDLKGKEYDSVELSKHIEELSNITSSITFIIGGSLGLNKEILKLANESICFSKMTFPHQLIRVFLLEQLFRSFKISKNETYHK